MTWYAPPPGRARRGATVAWSPVPPRTSDGPAVLTDLSPLIAATARWLTVAYPPCGGALASALCEAQARQAVTVAAWLRYPTAIDAGLVTMAVSYTHL